jgi:hypothetical protein
MENEMGKLSKPQDTGRCKLLQLAANLAVFGIKQTEKNCLPLFLIHWQKFSPHFSGTKVFFGPNPLFSGKNLFLGNIGFVEMRCGWMTEIDTGT